MGLYLSKFIIDYVDPQLIPSQYIDSYSREVLVGVLTDPKHPTAQEIKLPLPPTKVPIVTTILGLKTPKIDTDMKTLNQWELNLQSLANKVFPPLEFTSQWINKEEADYVLNKYFNKYLPKKRVDFGDITSDDSTTRFAFQGMGFSQVKLTTNEDKQKFSTDKPYYKVCYSFMNNFSTLSNQLDNHGANAYFSNFDSQSLPVLLAIEKSNIIYFPKDKEWEYMKFVFRSAAMIYATVVEHAAFTHFNISNSCNIAAREILSEKSVLRRLLHIFTVGSAQINLAAAYLLIPEKGGFSRKGLGDTGLKQLLEYGIENYKWRNFDDLVFENDLTDKNLPIVDHGLKVWNCIENFVHEFVSNYINFKDDQLIKFWIRLHELMIISDNESLNYTSFVKWLTNFIFIVTAWHSHVGQAVEYFHPYGYTWGLRKNIPSSSRMSLGIGYWTVLGTGTVSPKLLDNWSHIFRDIEFDYNINPKQLFCDFQKNMNEISVNIDKENLNSQWPFQNFNPKYFLSSVSI